MFTTWKLRVHICLAELFFQVMALRKLFIGECSDGSKDGQWMANGWPYTDSAPGLITTFIFYGIFTNASFSSLLLSTTTSLTFWLASLETETSVLDDDVRLRR